MTGISKTELWEELDATDEAFVRRKYDMGGYGPSKQRAVGQWIARKDAVKQASKAAFDVQTARQAVFWARAAACASWAAAFAAVVALFK